MAEEENIQQSVNAVSDHAFTPDQIVTPETFSLQWNSDPVDLLNIPLNFPYSSSEWDAIFETFIHLLSHKERHIWDKAIHKLIQALEMEASQRSNCDDYQPKPTNERVKNIFEAIATHTLNTPNIFEVFCSSFKFLAKKLPYRDLVLEWLDELARSGDRQAPTQEAILAAQILFGAYDSNWQNVGTFLIELLDHNNLTIRACAAHQIGKFFSNAVYSKDEIWEWARDNDRYEQDKQSVVGMPPPAAIMQLIRDKELERPGVAGAFWDVIPKKEVDAKEWLLDILEHSSDPEPEIPYFPCNLAFDAHERFRKDADAIRRLIDMGRVGLALMAATDEPCKVALLDPLLIELGNYDNPEMIRIASWHLAYYYHYLHPRGAELGYVELVDKLPEVDIFLLFNQKDSESPYALVIYAKGRDQMLSRSIAEKWVNQVFPETVRGAPREDLLPNHSHWYQRGYIDYHVSSKHADSDLIDNAIIGYRSKLPWNPKQFL